MKKIVQVLLVLMLMFTVGFDSVPTYAAHYFQAQGLKKVKGKLNAGEVSMYVGEKFQLTLTGAKAKSWRSNDTEVVKVDKTGKLTAKSVGCANVVAVVSENEVYLCRVEVKPAALNKTASLMYEGTSQTLKLSGAKQANWKSSDETIATVSSKGAVKAKKAGDAIITCTEKNGEKYQCAISVLKKSSKNESASLEEVKKAAGKYEINKIYVEGKKAFCYYATNGALGEAPSNKDIALELHKKYPMASLNTTMNCVIQYCDGADAMNWCDYSLYYLEYSVVKESETKYHIVNEAVGETSYDYYSKADKEKVLMITREAFPELYSAVILHDLNADGWLSARELTEFAELTVYTPISDLTGLNKLTGVSIINLMNFTGDSISFKGKNLLNWYIYPNTSGSVKINLPYAQNVSVNKFYEKRGRYMYETIPLALDFSGCKSLTTLYADCANGICTIKMPTKAPELKELTLYGAAYKNPDLKRYANLQKVGMSYCKNLVSLDLSGNASVTQVVAYYNPKLKQDKIALPKGAELQYR